MEEMELSPTPPLPIRHPSHHLHPHNHPLPPIPESPSTIRLVPPPLFSRRTYHGREAIHVAVLEIPNLSLSSNTSSSLSPSSPRSSISWTSYSPPTSAPGSPTTRARSLSYPSSPPSIYAATVWDAIPHHSLRRKPSPKRESLRAIRAKESDACLKRIYERQTSAYLDGTMFVSPKADRTSDWN
ncbi:uncharacterized protein BDR25DRAFT_299656 [Lindgomyces ingoldianus]|uniref:Uncharacterized protein n=1 Tax=Lindgomyces ingoldianus TaxID=673940 RepID=A0ACB6RHU9_9PLEO|nr:uncharacterized protein BDR25DRAFT_299656 [Lindgomyces ingoldianus]KAF2477905.1 hypothetical protein BDR25DRAFT_299656 [Lindgomyces ingoldianus]